jgi:hypothetical protein
MTSKRRLIKVIIYAIYLYLFFKRFAFALKYFRNVLRNLLSSWIEKLSFSGSVLGLHKRLAGKKENVSPRILLLLKMITKVKKVTLFLYNVFIFVQLCCIGYAETFRLKSILAAMLNSVKTLRIKDKKK